MPPNRMASEAVKRYLKPIRMRAPTIIHVTLENYGLLELFGRTTSGFNASTCIPFGIDVGSSTVVFEEADFACVCTILSSKGDVVPETDVIISEMAALAMLAGIA